MRFRLKAAAAFVAAAAFAVAGYTFASSQRAPTVDTTSSCAQPAVGFDCDFQDRIAAVQSYLDGRPGATGVVLHDLRTGAVWRNDHAGDLMWTASTIKLGMVVDLFTRDRAGEISLTDADRELITAMLHSSDDDAANTLWRRYAGADHMAYNRSFPAYGLTSLEPQKGFSDFYPHWGFQKCTPDDLDRLLHYVLTDLPPEERSYIVGEMRNVDPNQQWGVWGAGPAGQPGNKNGWSDEEGGWVMNTVGFVGHGERYTLAAMNNLAGEGGYDEGRETVTHVAELLFAGRF